MTGAYIEIHHGDKQLYESQLEAHLQLRNWLTQRGPSYGLPQRIEELDEGGKETLIELFNGQGTSGLVLATDATLTAPKSLALPRLHIELSLSPGLKKTTENFVALINGTTHKSKKSPFNALSYRSTPIHRIEKGFIVQGGDVGKMGDGSTGESIYGGSFNDEKEGLKRPFVRGTVGMANSGKNTNTSQFFITLTSQPAQLDKLTGKYVAFGQIDLTEEAQKTLDVLDSLGNGKGGTSEKLWIGNCGIVP